MSNAVQTPNLRGRVSAVYRIDFAGKFYIGSSVHVADRWRCHIASAPAWGAHLIGRVNTPEQIARMAAKLRGRKVGERSAETRARLSTALKGKKKSPEHIEKMRINAIAQGARRAAARVLANV